MKRERKYKFGNLDKRELIIRLSRPYNWWRSIWEKYGWAFFYNYHKDNNYRCYCPFGSSFDMRICIAGWNMNLWYSNYTGPLPCPCDEALAELEEEPDEDEKSYMVADNETGGYAPRGGE